MKRSFRVTSIEGHTDITTFSSIGPAFHQVAVTAENHLGETIEFYRPMDDQPEIGDLVEFEERRDIVSPSDGVRDAVREALYPWLHLTGAEQDEALAQAVDEVAEAVMSVLL